MLRVLSFFSPTSLPLIIGLSLLYAQNHVFCVEKDDRKGLLFSLESSFLLTQIVLFQDFFPMVHLVNYQFSALVFSSCHLDFASKNEPFKPNFKKGDKDDC